MALTYSFPAARLKRGHSFGNSAVYLTLDGNSDVLGEAGSMRQGMRDAYSQNYYLFGWQVGLAAGENRFEPVETTFSPFGQATSLRLGKMTGHKRFVLPYENNLLTAAHFVLERGTGFQPVSVGTPGLEARATFKALVVTSRSVLPPGTGVAEAEQDGHRHLAITYPDGTAGVIWASGPLAAFAATTATDGKVELAARFSWDRGRQYGVSFAYGTRGIHVPLAAVQEACAPDAGSPAAHLRRLRVIEEETTAAIRGRLETCRLRTPDAFINDGLDWAKANQLKDYQEYRGGAGFSNNPPSDVLVGRDTFWFLAGASYHAPAWARRLLDFWLRAGVEPNGKFVEYLHASSEPLFRDDYGLNINDNTPLLLIAAHQYYSLTADRGFLAGAYPALLRSADYILAQRNPEGLVWCRSRDHFVRGLCGWRNCTRNYQLSGAVTEINAECRRALAVTAELAQAAGDRPNAARLEAAAQALQAAIELHLRSDTPHNPFYLLNIDPDGRRVDAMTGDLLFPALFGAASRRTSRAILDELFGERFWQGSPTGAGGIRTVSAAQAGYQPKADPDTYGLQGGVWPNLALWAARAAADAGRPDLVVRALRATRRLADREDFDRVNVTPGEFPEYYNGDDLVQRGAPRSTFIHGSYLWAAWEGLLGMSPHANGLEVNPVLPKEWGWVAMEAMPYRGGRLSLLAVKASRTIYTTIRIKTKWRQVVVADQKWHGHLAHVSNAHGQDARATLSQTH